MNKHDDENKNHLEREEYCCDHDAHLRGFEEETLGSTLCGQDCKHEKVVPVVSWQQEGAREMSFRFFCLICKILFEQTIQPEERKCGKCGESYFYYPYAHQ